MVRNRISQALATGFFALVLAFGLVLAGATPALADGDIDSQTVTDGIVTMKVERVAGDQYGDFFKFTVTADTRGIIRTGGDVEFYLHGEPQDLQLLINDPTYEPLLSLDGGGSMPLMGNHLGSIGGGMALSPYVDGSYCGNHLITLTFWARDPLSGSFGTKTAQTLDVIVDPQGANPTTYTCAVDFARPGSLIAKWVDNSGIVNRRPSMTDFEDSVTLSVNGNPYPDAVMTVHGESTGTTQDLYSYVAVPTTNTLLTPHGVTPNVTFNVPTFDNYTVSATSVDAMAADEADRTITYTRSSERYVTNGSLTVSLKDADTGAPLPGATYELRGTSSTVASFTTDANGAFTIDPTSYRLCSRLYLYSGYTKGYTLVETAAPEGYELDATEHPVSISLASVRDDATQTTTATYTFLIDEEPVTSTTLTNTKAAAQSTSPTSPTNPARQPKPQPAKATATPRTCDATTSSAALAVLTAAGIGAVIVGRRVRRHEA
jgi:hypothetical protein